MIVAVGKCLNVRFSKICNIEIFYKGKFLKLKALIDSGNLLKENISNLPVVIVEKNVLKGLIDSYILENVDNILKGKFLNDDNLKIYDYKLRIIPFSSLGNPNGLLLGFKPDYIKVYGDDAFSKKEVFVGIYEKSFCSEYSAIIGL